MGFWRKTALAVGDEAALPVRNLAKGLKTTALTSLSLFCICSGWKISLLFGAGMGSVLVLRWLWERINLFSELFAIMASLVTGVTLLKLLPGNESEWIRLALMGIISTSVAIGVTFFTPATDAEKLKQQRMAETRAEEPRAGACGAAFKRFDFGDRSCHNDAIGVDSRGVENLFAVWRQKPIGRTFW